MSERSRYTFLFTALLALVMGAAIAPLGQAQSGSNGAPRVLLPGDAVIGSAPGLKDKPQIAAGGSGYLAIWEDARTRANDVSAGQSLMDIYAARLDANGQLIDTVPIVVSQASFEQTQARVAWNGQNWLVVWRTRRPTDFTTTTDIKAARVSPDGRVLDSPPLVIDDSPNDYEDYPVVASDGSDWAVVWMDGGNGAEHLRGTRVSPSGAVQNPGGAVVYAPSPPDAPANPSIAFAGDRYLLAFQSYSSGTFNNISGLLVNTALQPIGGRFNISNSNGDQYTPDVASNGTDFFAAWQDTRSGQGVGAFGTRVTSTGQALDPSGVDISGSRRGFVRPDLAWDGAQWLATWVDYDYNVYLGRISTTGQVLDPAGIPVGSGAITSASAVAGRPAGGAQVVWSHVPSGDIDYVEVASRTVSAEGVPGESEVLSLGAPSQRQLDLAANGSGYMAVFVSEVQGEVRIKGQRLDAGGNALDVEPILIAGGSVHLRSPQVAWNGSLYLVVWEDRSVIRGFVPGAIMGKRVSADGTVLDPNPFEILPGNTPDVTALGDNFLVVSTHEEINHNRRPKAVRVSGAGVVLGTPVLIGGSFARDPSVTALGSRWLAVWQRHPSHDNPRSSAYGNFINPDGTPGAEFLIASGGLLPIRDVRVGASPDQALIVFFETEQGNATSGDLYARRILPDGTLLDSTWIRVTSAPQSQLLPSVAWTGAEYVIAYEDWRNVPYLDNPISDIYGSRVDANGTLLDPNGFAVANETIPEVQPAVAALNGSYLIGFSNFRHLPPFGAYRIDVRRGNSGGPPLPEASGTSTATSTATSTGTPSSTSLPASATSTPVQATSTTATPPGNTATRTVTSTSTPTGVPPGNTATRTVTPTGVPPTTTPAVCTISFSDVPADHTFYTYVTCLACRGILGGYDDGTFRPGNDVTRGQLSKIVSNAAGFAEPVSGQRFFDVPPGSPFYEYIERMAVRGIIAGYGDGTFRPGNSATRGQISKIVANAAGYNDMPTGQTFEDVPPSDTFYEWIERLATRNVMGGYPCGGAGEPCGIGSRPYFRPQNIVTRGQSSKIIANVFFPNCQP